MKNYKDITWDDIRSSGYISPILGINAVTTMQIAEFLGVETKQLTKMRSKAKKDLEALGSFTAGMKTLIEQIPAAEKVNYTEYNLPLEDGGTTLVPSSPIAFYTAPSMARLIDEFHGEVEKPPKSAKTKQKTGSKTIKLCKSIPNSGDISIINIQGIDGYEKDGVVYLRLETVARGLGFTREKNGIQYVMWDRIGQYLSDFRFHVDQGFGFPHKCGKKSGPIGAEEVPKSTISPTCWGRNSQSTGAEEFQENTAVPTSWDGNQKRLGAEGLPAFIPENVFYRLAMKAKNAVAEEFQAKIADEVVPSIRKYGMYATEDVIDKFLSDPESINKVIKSLKKEREKNIALDQENRMLAKKEQTWNDINILNRLVRMYSHYVCGGNFQAGWRTFYRELYYKKGISMKHRSGDGPYVNRATPDELKEMIAVAMAMCKSHDIDLQWAVNQTNAEILDGHANDSKETESA